MRKFLTFDGDVLEETEWTLKMTDMCFYCDMPLVFNSPVSYCPKSMDNNHDWITLVNPSSRR